MGKLDDTDPIIIHHFSHQHPLKLLNFQPQTTPTSTCAGCKREASGWIYSCSTCHYQLHKPCSKMPQTLSHMADTKHVLALLSSPAYPEGAFKCNACGGLGTGFCYHCKECEIDIHTICAFMPCSIKHHAHDHPLDLCFNPPYDGMGFMCDICKGTGSNHWLYRCDSCEFDAHMKCAKANTKSQPSSSGIQQNQHSHGHSQCTNTGNGFSKGTQPPFQPFFDVPQNPPPSRTNKIVNDVLGHVIEGTVDGIAQQAGQAIGISYGHAQFHNTGNGFSKGTQPPFQPFFGVPQNPPPSITNKIVNDVLGHVIEGIMDGIAQQAGQALLEGVLGD